jgi:hypothetical protein
MKELKKRSYIPWVLRNSPDYIFKGSRLYRSSLGHERRDFFKFGISGSVKLTSSSLLDLKSNGVFHFIISTKGNIRLPKIQLNLYDNNYFSSDQSEWIRRF